MAYEQAQRAPQEPLQRDSAPEPEQPAEEVRAAAAAAAA
eukprot:COSAG06_NODE_48520_length_331_cov_1.107759_1_plen_38_part_01